MTIKYTTLRVATCTECSNVWKESLASTKGADVGKGGDRLIARVGAHRCKAMMQGEIDVLTAQLYKDAIQNARGSGSGYTCTCNCRGE